MNARTLDLDLARQALASQPFSVYLGARLTAFGDGAATLELDVREELRQQNGFLHGGVLGYAADNALTFAAGTVAGPRLLTAGYTIDYLRPARGEVLRAHAQVVRPGRTRVVCRCDLYTIDAAGDATLCAVAQGAIALTPDVRSQPAGGRLTEIPAGSPNHPPRTSTPVGTEGSAGSRR